MDTRAIHEFLTYIETQKRYSPHTISNYKRDLEQFLEYAKPANNESLTDVNKRACKHYLFYLDGLDLSPATIHRKISSLRSCWAYLCQQGITTDNPWKSLILPKKPKLLPTALDYQNIEKFLDYIPEGSSLQLRDRAILEILFCSGLRVNELIKLNMADIKHGTHDLKILGKGNKERIVFLGKEAQSRLTTYIRCSRTELLNPLFSDEQAIFLTKSGNRISARHVQRLIKKVAEGLNINQTITPHTFRHSFATQLHKGGANLRTIQRLLGHESLTTTQIYTKVHPKKLLETYRNFENNIELDPS